MTYKKLGKPAKEYQDASYKKLLEALVEMRLNNMERVEKLYCGELALLKKAREDLDNYKNDRKERKKTTK